MKTILLIVPIAVSLLIPAGALARDHDDHHDNRHHVYDKRHKDYHDFDEHEERAYHMYWEKRHKQYVDWDRASARQRQDYWNWRHSHSDAVLQINIH